MEIILVAPGLWDREALLAQGAQLCGSEGGNKHSQTPVSHLTSRWVLIPVHKIGETGFWQGKK